MCEHIADMLISFLTRRGIPVTDMWGQRYMILLRKQYVFQSSECTAKIQTSFSITNISRLVGERHSAYQHFYQACTYTIVLYYNLQKPGNSGNFLALLNVLFSQ